MMLYLLRHAEAVDIAASDRERSLTGKGRDQAGHVAKFCKAQDLRPELIVTSPYLRARETAEIVSAGLEVPCTVSAVLASGMRPEPALQELKSMAKFESIMLVGHEPDLSLLAALLVGVEEHDRLHVRKACLIGLRIQRLAAGGGILDFMIPAKLM